MVSAIPSSKRFRGAQPERAQLARVEGVAAVVAGPVLDVAHERLVRAGQLEDARDDLDVLALVVTADVVDLPGRALAQDELDPGAVVLDPEPVADLAPVAVDGQRLAVERVRGHQRDQLLRILVRAVGVRAAGDRRVDAERPGVGRDVQVTGRLGDAVGARRLDRIGLGGGAAGGEIAVHLVGRDLDESRARAANLLEQDLRPEELRPAEIGGAEDRAVDVRLGREVDDRIAIGGGLGHRGRVADVRDDDVDAGSVEVGRVARIGQLVEHAHVVARRLEPLGEMGADEPGPAGDEHAHGPKAT